MATHSSILAWKIPWAKEPGGATVHGVSRSWTWLSEQHFQRNWGLGVFFDHKAKHREAEIANPVEVQCCQPSRIFIKAHPRPFLHGHTEVGAVPQGTRVFHVFWHLFSLPPKHIFAHLINACLFVFFKSSFNSVRVSLPLQGLHWLPPFSSKKNR